MRFTELAATAALTATLSIPTVAFFTIPPAHADSLTTAESNFVVQYGETVVCPTIAKYPSIGGVIGVVKGVMDQGFTPKEAVDITNASVAMYCPTHWKLLQQTGQYFRDQAKGGQSV